MRVIRIARWMCASTALLSAACATEPPRRRERILADGERVPVRTSSLDALARCASADDDYGPDFSTRFDEDAPPVSTAEGRFDARIEQDGRALPIRDHDVALRRAPFELVITLPIGRGVYVSTSVHAAVFDAARNRRPLLRHFRSAAVVAEELEDADADLWLDEEPSVHWKADAKGGAEWACEASSAMLQYLYYDAPDEHRFSAVQFARGRMIGRRRVAAVKRPVEMLGKKRYRSEEEAYVDQRIEDVVEDALYVVLVEDSPGSEAWVPAEREDFERRNPLQRRYFRLRFVGGAGVR